MDMHWAPPLAALSTVLIFGVLMIGFDLIRNRNAKHRARKMVR